MNKTVLIIEDTDDVRELLQLGLSMHGFNTQGAANGKEALELLATITPPCVILLDLMMPVMNGWEFQARLSTDPRFTNIPIVVISADGNIDQRARELGAVSYLKKPIGLPKLIEVAKQYCTV